MTVDKELSVCSFCGRRYDADDPNDGWNEELCLDCVEGDDSVDFLAACERAS